MWCRQVVWHREAAMCSTSNCPSGNLPPVPGFAACATPLLAHQPAEQDPRRDEVVVGAARRLGHDVGVCRDGPRDGDEQGARNGPVCCSAAAQQRSLADGRSVRVQASAQGKHAPAGLKPSAVAGGPSVTRLTHSSCTGMRPSGRPSAAARKMEATCMARQAGREGVLLRMPASPSAAPAGATAERERGQHARSVPCSLPRRCWRRSCSG